MFWFKADTWSGPNYRVYKFAFDSDYSQVPALPVWFVSWSVSHDWMGPITVLDPSIPLILGGGLKPIPGQDCVCRHRLSVRWVHLRPYLWIFSLLGTFWNSSWPRLSRATGTLQICPHINFLLRLNCHLHIKWNLSVDLGLTVVNPLV